MPDMNKILLHIALIAAMLGSIIIPATAANTEATDSNSHPIKVSLITYYPGNEIFEVFGHSEILISDSTGNFYINYGVFDFNSPGFLTRYIMGETDYLCAVMPPEHDGGIKEGRKMVQQELNLTPEQAQHVWNKLSWNAMPENREYRYRHFSDNCSTRPRDVIESALGRELDYSKCNYIVGKTLREVMRHYTKNYPWEQFGIDLALGAACDTMIDVRTQTFVPLFLMHAIDSATVTQNGKQVPLVSKTDIIAPGSDNGIIAPPTPWYISPVAIALLVLVITIFITIKDWRRGKLSRWFDTALFTIAGLSGCLIFFIEFISTHEATMPNYNILWINPLMLLLAILSWFKKAKKTLRLCHMVNIALIATMVVVWLSGLQAPNTAFIPLIAALLLRSIINLRKKSA